MILEEKKRHPSRTDIYLNKIIASKEEILEEDKYIINIILLKEVAIKFS
ncbi:MAG: hypothetical protein ACFFAN_11170 [Promethearchaeota archaeon]